MDVRQTPCRLHMGKILFAGFLSVLLTSCLDGKNNFNALDPGSTDSNQSVHIVTALPAATSVSVTSTGSQIFSVTAEGPKAINYEWTLNGTSVATGSSSYQFDGTSHPVGTNTLKVVASDGVSSDSHSWQVERNAPPVITTYSPNQSTYKMNDAATANFSVTATDANNDTLTYSWKFNGASGGPVGAGNTASITLTPTAADVGSNTLTVTVSDGVESVTQSWTVEVNYFTETCNRLQIGQICTLAGDPNIGNGLDPTVDETKIKIRPRTMLDDGTGNLFIADDANDIIWFYNRSTSPVTIGTHTIAAGTIGAIIGSGGYGKGTSQPNSLDFKISNPEQMFWDATAQTLYVADSGNNRIIALPPSGQVVVVHGGGAGAGSTTVWTAGNTLDCNSATGVVKVGNILYVACYGRHLIRAIDLTQPSTYPALNIAGAYNTAGNVDGVANTVGRMTNPRHLQADSEGNIYWNGYIDCTIKAYRPTSLAGSLTFYSGQGDQTVINPGEMRTIAGGVPTSCTNASGTPKTQTRFDNPIGFAMKPDHSGFFVSTFSGSYQVRYINNSASTVTVGNVAVSAYHSAVVVNTSGATGFNGDGFTGALTRLYGPYDVSLSTDLSTLFISEYYNIRGRSLDLSVPAGLVNTVFGAGRVRSGFIGDSELPAPEQFINTPSDLVIDNVNRKIYFSDTGNSRIRFIDLLKGTLGTVIGKGAGDGDTDDEYPSNVLMRSPRGVAMVGGNLFYADQSSNNCLVRGLNNGTSPATIFGNFMNPGRVSTIAGGLTQGCGLFSGPGTALNATLNNLEGLTSDGTNLYVADYTDHCILKISQSGSTANISVAVGSCGTTADQEGDPITQARLLFPAGIYVDPADTTYGNLYIADRTNQTVSKIRYVNFDPVNSRTIGGVTIPPNYMGTLTSCNRCYGVAASTTEFCYASGADSANGDNNITCVDRTTGLQTLRVGPPSGGVSGGGPLSYEQEGVTSTSARLDSPYSLAFDSDGNLYFVDKYNHIIRYVRRH